MNNNRRPPSVLVVEDDRVIAGSIGAHLRHAGMAVECVEDGDRALRKVRFERPDAVVLDLMLPGLDGWQVLRELRAGGTECPIVVVSARASEQDKVQVLKMGADDYVRQAVRDERARGPRRGGAPPQPDHAPGRPAREAHRCPGSRSTPTCTASSWTGPTPASRRSSSGCSRPSPPRAAAS